MKIILKFLFLLFVFYASAFADPSTPDLIPSDDNGTSNTDNRTSDTTLTFTGTKSLDENVSLYRDGSYIGYDDSYTTSYSITDNTGTSGNYYAVGNTQSSSLYVEVVTFAYSGNVYIDDVTADNNINENEDDGFVTVSGTASSGDISTGDSVEVTINSNTYNTSVSSSGTWSFSVLGSDIINDSDFYVYVDSYNEFGYYVQSSGYKSVGTDNSATISINNVYSQIQSINGEFLEDGIGIDIISDIEYARQRRILINGVEYNFDNIDYLFIENSDLGLVDGNTYEITSKSGITDAAGNTAPVSSYFYTYDAVGNDINNAKPIDIGTQNSNLFDATDIDYFLLKVPEKGMLNISAIGTVELKSLDDTLISSAFPVLVEEGSYLVKVYNGSGDYTLDTTLTEYFEEIDSSATPTAVLDGGFSASLTNTTPYIYIDGNMLCTSQGEGKNLTNGNDVFLATVYSANKFVLKDANEIYVDDFNLNVNNVQNGQNTSVYIGAGVTSLSVVDNTAYVMVGTTVQRYDISDYNSIVKNTTDIPLPSTTETYDEILAYSDGSNSYIYVKDSASNLYLYDVTDPTSVTLLKVFDRYSVNDFAIDNGLLYITTGAGYVFVYDIDTDASKPKQILRFTTIGYPTAIDAHGGYVYVNEGSANPTTIRRYSLDFDFDDTMPANPSELSKIQLNSTISMNKYSNVDGTADVDIFRVDTEYFGNLSFATSGVDSANLTITVDDNSNFSSPLVSASSIVNTTVSGGLSNLSAQTYYVKISSTDTDSFDDYSLTTTFTKTETSDILDALLNIAVNKQTSLDLNVTVNSNLTSSGTGSDIDLYKIEIPSNGNLSIANPNAKTITLHTADIDSSNSYVILSGSIAQGDIDAGIYYIKVSGADGAYSITPNFTSYSSSDEYTNSLTVSNVGDIYSSLVNSVKLDGAFINSASDYGVGLYGNSYIPQSYKKYLSQVSNGDYIYALYRHVYSNDGGSTQNVEVGIDKLEYIDDYKVVFVNNTVVSGATSTTFDYKLNFTDGQIYVRKDDGWFVYDGLNNIIASTSSYDPSYIDFDIFNGVTYGVNSLSVENLSTNKYNSFDNIVSIELYDGVVYVGTSDDGIKALDIDTLDLIKEIENVRNITSLENIGNKLYVLDNRYDDYGNLISSDLKTLDIERDFGDDFANAYLIFDGVGTSGRISSASDADYFKINMDYTASITTSLDVGTCEMFNSSLVSIGSCTSADLKSGTYYLKVTNGAATNYNITSTISITNSDQQDTTRFYDGNTVITADINSALFSSFADTVGDVDMFRIYVDSTGYITLDNGAVLVYENGTPVPFADGKYQIDNTGYYFIKTTNITADVHATFTSMDDEQFIDNTTTENDLLSSLVTSGSSSKIISSGVYAYLVDEVDGLSIIDLSDPEDPSIRSRVNLKGTPKDIYLDGSILYVALGSDGFTIIDVSDVNAPFLYSQTNISENVSNIVAKGKFVYISIPDTIKKYDISKPDDPSFEVQKTLASAADILVDDSYLLVATISGVAKLNQSNLSTVSTASLNGALKLAKDGEYIFVENASQSINILNLSDLSDTGKIVSLTDTRNDTGSVSSTINDIYLNNRILYISKSYGYEVIDYKDINNIASSAFGTASSTSVNSIAFVNSSIVLAKDRSIKILQGISDYADSINVYSIKSLDMNNDINSTITTGQFSSADDIDSFYYINNYYTGTLNINVDASHDVNITLYSSDGTVLNSGINSVTQILNADNVYLEIQSTNGDLDSYEIFQNYEIDGEIDIVDNSLNYENISQGSTINGNLYADGNDKDYFELTMTERGTINFNTNGDTKVKVTLLYKSGTVIASNYDEQTGTLESEFEAELSSGDYFVLVENFEPSVNETTHDYQISTGFTSNGVIDLDSGASQTPLTDISSFSYVKRHSYILKGGVLSRLSNILEPKQSLQLPDFSDTNSVYKVFSYDNGNEEISYVSGIDLNDNFNNNIIKILYNNTDGLARHYNIYDMSGITDEEIMYIDMDEFIYYYDEDSLYISSLSDTLLSQQIAIENLNLLNVRGNYMYLATDDKIDIVDISDKEDIDSSKILSSIDINNIKSIYIDENGNRLFVGANNKLTVFNISDKERVELLSEYDIGFNHNDLWYEGNPTSIYMVDEKLYTTVEGVGIVVFNIDEFNALSISYKALNLGENLSQIYTFHGDAINYVIDNELKVYFSSSEILNPDSSSTTSVVKNSSISEGSGVIEGCFIATAAYGTYFEDDVKVLRDFRDKYLKTNVIGQVLVKTYYKYSPPIAKVISKNEILKFVIRVVLTPIVLVIKYPVLLLLVLFTILFLTYKKMKIKSKRLGTI